MNAVTPLGRLIALIGLCSLVAGYVLGWAEFVPIVWTVLAMFGVAVLSLLGSSRHSVRLVLRTPRVRVGTPAQVDVLVSNRLETPLARTTVTVTIAGEEESIEIPPLLRRGQTTAILELPTARRGVYTVGPTVIGRRDPLRLLQRRSESTDSFEQFVHPRTVALPGVSAGFFADLDGIASRDLTPRDIAFHSIREYARGDDMRMVHWRSTAKSGTLMVRQFEQSRHSSLVILLDTRAMSYSGRGAFELAVSAVASLSDRALAEGRAVAVLATASSGPRSTLADRTLPARTRDVLFDALARLTTSQEAEAVDELGRRAARSIRDAALVGVVCGDRTAFTDLAAVADAYRACATVVAVRCEPGADPSFRKVSGPAVFTIGLLEDLRRGALRAGNT